MEHLIIRIDGSAATTALLVITAFLLGHPYGGIHHDGLLYAGEALVRLDPARMGDDLFFFYGSQGSFSVIPAIYGRVVEWCGVGDAARLLLMLSLGAFLLATWWILKPILSADVRTWSIVLLVVASPSYGGHRVFGYGETFFTARGVAEAVVLFGLGWLVRGRNVPAIACLLCAVAVHPLMALPALLLALCWLIAEDRRWGGAIALGLVPLGLAFAGVSPFDSLFSTYDPAWFAVVKEANPFVFPSTWFASDWASVVFDGSIAAWVAFRFTKTNPSLARLCRCACLAGVLGLVASSLSSDLFRNVFLTGLQLWRTQWLLHWIAVAAVVLLVHDLWRARGQNEQGAALLTIASVLSLGTFGPLIFAPCAIAMVVWPHRYRVSPVVFITLKALCGALALIHFGRQASALSSFAGLLGGDWFIVLTRPLAFSLVIVALVAAGLRYLPRRPLIGSVMASLLAALAMAGWDQRESWTKYQENYVRDRGLLWANEVKAGDRIYWYREVGAPWLMMRHANYYSPAQSAGVLFNRETAIELSKRSSVVAALEFQETVCRIMNGLNKDPSACEPDLSAARTVCDTADRLSFIVLNSKLPVIPVSVLDTGIIEDGHQKNFRLYRCSDITHAPQTTGRIS